MSASNGVYVKVTKKLTMADGEVTPYTSIAYAESKHEVEGGRICLS